MPFDDSLIESASRNGGLVHSMELCSTVNLPAERLEQWIDADCFSFSPLLDLAPSNKARKAPRMIPLSLAPAMGMLSSYDRERRGATVGELELLWQVLTNSFVDVLLGEGIPLYLISVDEGFEIIMHEGIEYPMDRAALIIPFDKDLLALGGWE